jgi:antitoxin MazE
VRIPSAFARQLGLEENSSADLTIVGDRLVLEPSRPALTLDDLLADISDENIHAEVDPGSPVGNEAW